MGVTDCHVHINPIWEMHPDARALVGRGHAAAGLEQYVHDPRGFLEYLDRSGVERAVLVNYVSPEVVGYTDKANDFVRDYARADPARLIACGSVLPTAPHPAARVRELVHEFGIRALKLHPPHQRFDPNAYVHGNGEGLRAIYGQCADERIPVIVHTGTSVFPGARNRHAEPMLLEDVAIDFPKLTIVLAHAGRPLWMDQAVFLARRFANVFLELSSIPPARIPAWLPELPKVVEKTLFGSDWPGPGVTDIGANLAAFRALPFPPAMIERILTENAERVFPRRAH
ncbi:MAG TPA: amidohydrolase family protein [Thermoplasmata archaeon]|nr:amidohydrolase family protein [Thermoplasmata archaeon]